MPVDQYPVAPELYLTSGFLILNTSSEYMKEALRLAAKGRGKTSPNPLVGAVIVRDGNVLGKGYHRVFGGDHAEIEAIRNAGRNTEGATLYCTLEPCSHWGKTPPCVDALIEGKFSKVVIGAKDPNPNVNGKGIRKLKAAGITVETGLLEQECLEINSKYFKYASTGIPFVTLKMAQTLDGKIARKINSRTDITGKESQRFVHRLRIEHDAVLVGRKTAEIDDPLLTPRLVKGRTPKRIILDSTLSVSPDLQIFKTTDQGEVILATSSRDKSRTRMFTDMGITVLRVRQNKDGLLNLNDLLKKLGKMEVSSILVEGGAALFGSFTAARMIDRLILLVAPKIFGSGVAVMDTGLNNNNAVLQLKDIERKKLGNDLMISAVPDF